MQRYIRFKIFVNMSSINIQQLIPKNEILPITSLSVFNSEAYPLSIFDEKIIDFFNALSRQIVQHPLLRRVPAATSLAFWLRKGNLQRIIGENQHLIDNKKYKVQPVGTVFHVCPSNVDTMFLYSLAASLLVGNKNILRLSKSVNETYINHIIEEIRGLLQKNEFAVFNDYLSIVRYEREKEINHFFSTHADARVIWGGDATVNTFKEFATKPRVKDLYFADRRSAVIVKAAEFIHQTAEEQIKIANKFYNDSYTFDQRGCSSPQMIFILGNPSDTKTFEDTFYKLLVNIAEKEYENDITSLASHKLNYLAMDAMDGYAIAQKHDNNYLVFAEVDTLDTEKETCGGGYFYTKHIENIQEIKTFINKKVQTISYHGLNKADLEEIHQLSYGIGIDRIVPIGNALDFDYIWDGYNLIEELSTKKVIF